MKYISFKVILALFALGTLLFGLRQMALATPSNKITICHATSSTSNPYVMNQPNASGDVSGHDSHNGGVYFAGMSSWGDIIPPFDYQTTGIIGTHLACTDGGYSLVGTVCKKHNKPDEQPVVVNDYGTVTAHYAGKNWDSEGQAVWNNSCNIPALDCDGDYDNDPTDADDKSCMTTPTPTPTPVLDCDNDTDGSTPNDDDGCLVTPTATPTATITPTVTVTDTPTPTSTQSTTNGGSTGGDGLSDGRSDGGSSCPECTAAPQTQAVLGASTMAGTGTFENTVMMLSLICGLVLLSFSGRSILKEIK